MSVRILNMLLRQGILLLLAVSAASAGQSTANIGPDPGVPDTLYIDTASAKYPNQAILPIRFVSDDDLSAFEITLTYSGSELSIDSFSFLTGVVESFNFKDAIVDSNTITLFAFAVSEVPIPAGSGLIGRLYLSISPAALPKTIVIDTTIIILNLIEHATTFSSATNSVTYIPQISPGSVTVLDDCCLGLAGNIDNDPNDITDIADLTLLIDHLFINLLPLECITEGNIDGDINGTVDIADLTFLIDHLFINFPDPAACR